ncbi:uncharacterized protein LOC123213976 isoform X2 [Mangifera indica]|uniref:uncharacterized protein LOC123213976 isoform X2 n=1 Tax=Mangifera indica TaxID=29780 RepID=UPI001CFC1415|nr:uncharacterized protein LOC123213976 isoform X2 [Mangifera indica]
MVISVYLGSMVHSKGWWPLIPVQHNFTLAEMTSITSGHHFQWSLGIGNHLSKGRFYKITYIPYKILTSFHNQNLCSKYCCIRRCRTIFSCAIGNDKEPDYSGEEMSEKELPRGKIEGVNSEVLRENLERIGGSDDSTIGGMDLATLIRKKYGSSYDFQLIKKLGYDPSEELLGLGVDLKPRNIASSSPEPRSWFGPNGQYIREFPCPSCRGRGYNPCTECGIERSRLDCSLCNGKCLGDCVIWEESIDEQPWEKAHSISPLKVKDDDKVDNLDIKVYVKKKSKRVYHSPSPEVGLKISRSLKSLNAKTGLLSKRMKIIHRDPKLHAQRVAAIKKAKGTAAARKHASEALKAFFSDPENRRKRSLAMKGVRFYCKNCGREGHRRFYCPELKDSVTDRRFRCRLCGEKGHNRRTCPKTRSSNHEGILTNDQRCKICHQRGHNCRTCPQVSRVKLHDGNGTKEQEHILPSRSRTCTCRLCRDKGHNIRTCPIRNMEPLKLKPQIEE